MCPQKEKLVIYLHIKEGQKGREIIETPFFTSLDSSESFTKAK